MLNLLGVHQRALQELSATCKQSTSEIAIPTAAIAQTVATTHYGAGEAQIFGEIGYGLSLGQIAAEPFAVLVWVHLRTDNFNETGASVRSTVRATTVTLAIQPQNGMAFIPRPSIAWQHAFGTVDPTAALAFVSTGAAFTIAGVPLARDAALVEAGVDLEITGNAKVGVSYAGQLSNSVQDHSVKGNFTWRF
jgi:outer membrane autotransporter protein